MLIKDLVTMDEHGAFRSDVQLSDYENQKLNLDLLQNYIFTAHTPRTSAAQRDYASVDVLEALVRQAFLIERAGSEFNRIVLTANYGRGKSHLALVLANFFAHPADSPEVKTVMKRLAQSLNDNKPRLENIRDFKKKRDAFLVVRLRGDYCDDLQDAFLRGLEQSLNEHPSTSGIELPFWYTPAEKQLNKLEGEALQKADTFLSAHNMDVSLLISQLRKPGAYDLVRETFKQVTGFYPDFGREINLKDLILWAVDEVCIPNQLGGLLILFDEFSLFLRKYVDARTAGKLQELLNGISDRPGKSAFLAFTQIDIDTVAETYTRGQHLEDVKKELERLPKDKRARLFSLMESVLASYLKQDESAWKSWTQQQKVKGLLSQGRETLYEYFYSRYDRMLRWQPNTATETVVRGCFPLHPMTTAVLASHAFEAGASENPRTALQFVRKMWESYRNSPAERKDGTPNFVFATALVDFFGKQISEKWYAAYTNAIEMSPIALSDNHIKVLKALLLQQAVEEINQKKMRKSAQLELLHHLNGLKTDEIKELLREMGDNRVVYYDHWNKVSSLPPVGMRSQETEEIIQQIVDNTLLGDAVKKLNAAIPTFEISQNFGHVDDWSPRQIVFTEEQFKTKHLKELILPYRAGIDKIEDNPRGWVIWLIAQSEDEKITLRQSAQMVLTSVLGEMSDKPIPVVIVLPKRVTPGLIEVSRRLVALENLNQSDREKIGTLAYEYEKNLAEERFRKELASLWDGNLYVRRQRSIDEYILPDVYRASVQTLKDLSLKSVVTESYRQAYEFRLEFYAKYRVEGKGQNRLRTAVQKVSRGLFRDEINGSLSTLGNKDIQYKLSVSYLPQKWGLLTVDTYLIQPPTSRSPREAWNLLEDTFFPSCKEVRVKDVLISLLNPAYGHDYNTLTLLFSAWIGHSRHEIRFSLAGKVASLSDIKNLFDESKNPHDFLNRICLASPLAISRIEKDKLFAEAIDILEHIKQGSPPFGVGQASDALARLETAIENPALPVTQRDEIKKLRPRLDTALHKAQKYDEQTSEWLAQVRAADFDTLVRLRGNLDGLSVPTLVTPEQSAPSALRRRWETKIKRELDVFCSQYTQLKELNDYKSQASKLKQARRALKKYPNLSQRIEDALVQLDKRRDELKQQENEKAIIAEINSMTPSAELAVLYGYRKRLQSLRKLSSKTAKNRDVKARQIEFRIQQYESLASALSEAIKEATNLSALRQQRDSIISNLKQVERTPLYDSLKASQDNVEKLEAFFKQLRSLSSLSQNTPNNLAVIREKLIDIKRQFSSMLSPVQENLLSEEARKIDQMQRQKQHEALEWLNRLKKRLEKGEKLNTLLRELETPHAFLDKAGLEKTKQLKGVLREKLRDDAFTQIEVLFLELDLDARQKCLQHLQTLLDEAK